MSASASGFWEMKLSGPRFDDAAFNGVRVDHAAEARPLFNECVGNAGASQIVSGRKSGDAPADDDRAIHNTTA